ncbi:hypothetical protein GDO78_021981 [Eleutherodactylus coqui]|uniref:Uncharacterized protein n=1 Tax=Eleutherodactylus coqui TaxID=57060 RepID=A0A8J6B391_ELECQ|nr:hypothetical protein GDO78_021981 [Eleutherodactylus coqui]
MHRRSPDPSCPPPPSRQHGAQQFPSHHSKRTHTDELMGHLLKHRCSSVSWPPEGTSFITLKTWLYLNVLSAGKGSAHNMISRPGLAF